MYLSYSRIKSSLYREERVFGCVKGVSKNFIFTAWHFLYVYIYIVKFPPAVYIYNSQGAENLCISLILNFKRVSFISISLFHNKVTPKYTYRHIHNITMTITE